MEGGSTIAIRKALAAVALAIQFAGCLFAVDAGPARVIEVIADRDNTFKVSGEMKPVIKARAGEVLLLRITSHFGGEQARDGAEHSFVVKKLRNQGWHIRLKEGTGEYRLVAPQDPGQYLIECTVKCGRGHDDMNMKLIVTK